MSLKSLNSSSARPSGCLTPGVMDLWQLQEEIYSSTVSMFCVHDKALLYVGLRKLFAALT